MFVFDYDEIYADDPLQEVGTGILSLTGPAGEEDGVEQSAHSAYYPDCEWFLCKDPSPKKWVQVEAGAIGYALCV